MEQSTPTGTASPARSRWPWAGSGHGPLPSLLLLLTIVTGVVDAVSYVALGHVFVANMTGNVVFLGFALAGAPGLSAPASVAALAAFLTGAVVGGRLASRYEGHRGRHLGNATAASVAVVLLAVLLAAVVGQPVSHVARYALIVPLAIAMGLQNATARTLAVPDLTTTVLTQTLTGFAAESRLAGVAAPPRAGRRLLPVTAMFAGALAGALLVINVDLVLPLALAAALMATTALAAKRLAVDNPAWATPALRPGQSGRPTA